MPKTLMLSRRAAFAALTVPAAGAWVGTARAAPVSDSALRDICFLTPQSIEGPYYLDPRLVRAQIAEGRSGVPLRVDLRVIDGATCMPSVNARVDLWHADAQGIYSGYEGQGDKQDLSTVGQKFLRGTQFTDNKGAVSFQTIYPGWYAGRAVHIHYKVHPDTSKVFTSQLFFDDVLSEQVFAQAPYASKGTPDTLNSTDSIYQDLMLLTVNKTDQGYAATFDIGVQQT